MSSFAKLFLKLAAFFEDRRARSMNKQSIALHKRARYTRDAVARMAVLADCLDNDAAERLAHSANAGCNAEAIRHLTGAL